MKFFAFKRSEALRFSGKNEVIIVNSKSGNYSQPGNDLGVLIADKQIITERVTDHPLITHGSPGRSVKTVHDLT